MHPLLEMFIDDMKRSIMEIRLKPDSPAIASIKQSLATFDSDPADTDFQRGYQSALQDLLEQVFEAEQQSQPKR